MAGKKPEESPANPNEKIDPKTITQDKN